MPSSTWKNRNIFEDVLNLEDALTDALRNFLKYPPVRDALWRTLPENVREHINFSSIEDIETRPSDSRHLGVPDIVLYGSDFILVIEVKIGAELTDAQQEVYVPWIKEAIRDSQKEMGVVVFLVPDDYPHRVQLDSCIEEARGLCCSENANIQVLDPITWQKLVKEFESQHMPSLNELIREFYDHLSERFIPKPVRFSTEEVRLMHSRETASGVLKLMDIVEKVKDNSRSSGFQVSRLNAYNYGYDFSSLEKKVYFGIWWQFWAENGFPLCMAISKDHEGNQLIQATSQNQHGNQVLEFEDDDGEWLVVGYRLPEPDTDCSAPIGNIVTDIENLLREDSSESSEDAETP